MSAEIKPSTKSAERGVVLESGSLQDAFGRAQSSEITEPIENKKASATARALIIPICCSALRKFVYAKTKIPPPKIMRITITMILAIRTLPRLRFILKRPPSQTDFSPRSLSPHRHSAQAKGARRVTRHKQIKGPTLKETLPSVKIRGKKYHSQ